MDWSYSAFLFVPIMLPEQQQEMKGKKWFLDHAWKRAKTESDRTRIRVHIQVHFIVLTLQFLYPYCILQFMPGSIDEGHNLVMLQDYIQMIPKCTFWPQATQQKQSIYWHSVQRLLESGWGETNFGSALTRLNECGSLGPFAFHLWSWMRFYFPTWKLSATCE